MPYYILLLSAAHSFEVQSGAGGKYAIYTGQVGSSCGLCMNKQVQCRKYFTCKFIYTAHLRIIPFGHFIASAVIYISIIP